MTSALPQATVRLRPRWIQHVHDHASADLRSCRLRTLHQVQLDRVTQPVDGTDVPRQSPRRWKDLSLDLERHPARLRVQLKRSRAGQCIGDPTKAAVIANPYGRRHKAGDIISGLRLGGISHACDEQKYRRGTNEVAHPRLARRWSTSAWLVAAVLITSTF